MARKAPARADDLTKKIDDDELEDLFNAVSKGFDEQRDRADMVKDNWTLYNCKLDDRQFYNGTSQLALPFVHDAVEARVTRFTNQIFPVSGRFVEVTTAETDLPQATQSLLENYVRKCKIRTEVVPALLRNGDLEGTYAVYLSWTENKRIATYREEKQPTTGGLPNPATELVQDIKEVEIIDAMPDVEVISDPDLLVLPAASNSIEKALADGGSVTVLRRWSKAKIKKLIKAGEIDKEKGENLVEEMTKEERAKTIDITKENLCAAGIKERGKVCVVFETWKMIQVRPWNDARLCRVYQISADTTLSAVRNPFWNDRCPIIGGPLKKMAGAFKSRPAVNAGISDLQILANDTINEGADTAHFSAMPIVMTDPLKNPRVDTMSLGLAAVWETSPNDTKIVEFPELWRSAIERALSIKEQIFQSLGVNPSMIPQSTGGAKKRNQAELAIEQQVDILTTADVVTQLEELILTPLVQRFAEYDHQFRDKEKTIAVFGEMGQKANMEMVEPIQLNERFEFRWFGVEAARNAAMIQQQISTINVVKQIPPDQYPGYKLDLTPIIVQMMENTFGPRLARLVFHKMELVSVDPMVENEMLIHGFDVPVHPGDDDEMHIQAHLMALEVGDPHGKTQQHIAMHAQQMQAKAQQQQAQMQGGGGQGGRGQRSGAQPGQGRPAQQPAGAIHKDQMPKAGAVDMPRRPS